MAHGRSHSPDANNAHKSSERRWDKVIIRIDNKPIGARKIKCTTEGCGQEGELLDRTADGLPPSVIQRRFEQKGWEVGNSDKHDFCPACVEQQKIERRARRNGVGTKAVNIKLVSPQPAPQEPAMSSADTAIAVASREDKRIIFARLQDVYLDEARGYQSPWTDQSLAKDIGCPVAWVAQVRDDNFGPARDNSDIRDMLDRVEINAREASSILTEAKRLKGEVTMLVEQSNALNARIENVSRNLAGLLATADRIAKAVLP